ncbi:MAG: PhzF family phenazine biosynthesis protein [Leptospirales bacterium]
MATGWELIRMSFTSSSLPDPTHPRYHVSWAGNCRQPEQARPRKDFPLKRRQCQVDAFAHRLFAGNPAAVVPMDFWPEDSLLQSIAEENNLAGTAFFVPTVRGFTLLCEVDTRSGTLIEPE